METLSLRTREMGSKWMTWTLRCAMAIVAIVLALDLVYFTQGSLEMFPTEEKHSGIREVTGFVAVMLCMVEIALFLFLKRLRQASS
jgi:hypothetical protein